MEILYRNFNYLLDAALDEMETTPGKTNPVPEELIIDNVLTRLPASALAKCIFVSKLWYNSILNDTRFAARHFALQQNKNLFFNLLNVDIDGGKGVCIFNLQDDHKGNDDNVFIDIRLSMGVTFPIATELLGYCNGFACFKTGGDSGRAAINVFNPVRMNIQEEEEEEQVFVCMIITLGTNSWRKIVTKTSDISSPPGSPPFPRRMVTKAWKKDQRSATLCGGDLFWRITNYKGTLINDNGGGNVNGVPNGW
ncbi:uncharacterized protein LOC113361139 [Papaver somniferum]|uniref:uncharacterized protein LOC113361139 n=1 Tax=Papaver somniferum TaxID=3469 RepID=UPI000E701A5B|nr:uncharacterized protein LOC113361139 [Papaver somniferum]